MSFASCQGNATRGESTDGLSWPVSSRLDIGTFSVSLAVKDLDASRRFYSVLGFDEVGGNAQQGWLILRNGATTIGLFQGMFERNMLTFNPGWSLDGSHPSEFEDVRQLQHRFADAGLSFIVTADEATNGPASFLLSDPDGNPVLFDQHVPAPRTR
jgi:lactoylglutathione lyase